MNHTAVGRIQHKDRTRPVGPAPLYASRLGLLFFLVLGLVGQDLLGADSAGVGEKAKEIVRDTSVTVGQAGDAAAESVKDVWRRIDEARLRNRTFDELIAWVIMGVVVGAGAGMMTPLKTTGLGKVGRLLLGLAGAFLGGMVVHVAKLDFGWGPVLIRYEELFFSFVGAILIVAVGRLIHSRMKKQPAPR